MKFLVCFALSLFLVSSGAAQAQAPMSVSPQTVKGGTSPTLTVTSNGFFDLSQVKVSQIEITPPTDITNLQVSNASARSLTVSFQLGANAAAGSRALVITANDISVSMKLIVERAPVDPGLCRPTCRPPRECIDGRCVRPPRPVMCRPACRPPRICNEVGRCELPL